jgi:hypothetical protein
LGCRLSARQLRQTRLGRGEVDKQEAEASVGKLLGPLVDDGFESESLEEYGERWTGHAAAYDDDFGHLRIWGVFESRERV